VWWDERDQEIKILAIRPVLDTETIDDVTQDANILAESLAVRDEPSQRISRTLVYYKQTDPTKGPDDEANYARRATSIDEETESAEFYGEQRIFRVRARWLVSFGQAHALGYRLILRNKINPRYINFELDAKDRALWTGDLVDLTHRSIVDFTGQAVTGRYLIIESEEIDPGHRVRYECRSHEIDGRFAYTMEDTDSPTLTYNTATAAQRAEQFTGYIAEDVGGSPTGEHYGFSVDGSGPYLIF